MVKLRLPAKIESIDMFRSFVMAKIEEKGIPEALSQRVDLALEEILVNIFHYAYADEGPVEIECDASDPEKFRVIVTDWGIPFDPLDRETPKLIGNIAEMNVGGLGIHLTRHMVNELKYERKEGANILIMVFSSEAD